MLEVQQVSILGTGLLGGSIGLGLRAAGFAGRLVGYGRTPATLAEARAAGCVDEAVTDLAAAVRGSDLIILATPIGTMPELLARLGEAASPAAVVTDVGSTKRQVCEQAARLLARPERFVGSHPMAGSEQKGPSRARADLFRGRPCILTPPPDPDPGALETVRRLWTALGMRLTTMTPQEHDRKAARISHLPHAVAALLVELAREDGIDIASTGFRDTTRVASGDPHVWLDIFTSNAPAVVQAIDAMTALLACFRRELTGDDPRALLDRLRHVKEARDQWLAETQKAGAERPTGE